MMSAFIFMMEAALTMYAWNHIAEGTTLLDTNITYGTAIVITFLFQNLAGVFKHQFYDWQATKSESFLIQVMAKNPQAVKVFMEALVQRVKDEQESNEAETSDT